MEYLNAPLAVAGETETETEAGGGGVEVWVEVLQAAKKSDKASGERRLRIDMMRIFSEREAGEGNWTVGTSFMQ